MNTTVLFANDDVLTQWVMTEVLSETGFNVVSACRGREVAELLADAPDFDILIADVELPDTKSVLDIGNAWRCARPGSPVIYTGATRDALTQPLQFHEYFLKSPFNAATLLSTIRDALQDAPFRPFLPAMTRGIHHVN